MSDYPDVFRVRQQFNDPKLADVAGEVEAQMSRLSLGNKVKADQSVAITAGSRGIAEIHQIIKAIVAHFKQLGAHPFIVPAMGSHGGGTAVGQRNILESYGITEDYCGCPIRATMDTVIVCQAAEGFPVHFDKYAYQADHVVVCNRVKPHTSFTGPIESGLMKMMLIGLGKHAGAKTYHRAIREYDFGQIARSVSQHVLSKCSVVAGLALVENSYGQPAKIEAIGPEELEAREAALLVQAKQWMPRLPFRTADVLLIDEIGKNISGSGIDVNVVGRKHSIHQPAENEYPKIKMIGIRNLSHMTHGNAIGIGLAEFCRTRAVKKMDVKATRINVLTGGIHCEAMLPIDYETDRELLDVMLTQIGLAEPPDAKLMWIRNTKELVEVECSVAYLDEARTRDDLQILDDPRPLSFDPSGNLCDEHMVEKCDAKV